MLESLNDALVWQNNLSEEISPAISNTGNAPATLTPAKLTPTNHTAIAVTLDFLSLIALSLETFRLSLVSVRQTQDKAPQMNAAYCNKICEGR